MASNVFGAKSFQGAPPLKGSFPLDHDGMCKELMVKYFKCLNGANRENWSCRESAKEYLECRMKHELMAKEDWQKLGYGDPAKIPAAEDKVSSAASK